MYAHHQEFQCLWLETADLHDVPQPEQLPEFTPIFQLFNGQN
jgi:hypothetical protein